MKGKGKSKGNQKEKTHAINVGNKATSLQSCSVQLWQQWASTMGEYFNVWLVSRPESTPRSRMAQPGLDTLRIWSRIKDINNQQHCLVTTTYINNTDRSGTIHQCNGRHPHSNSHQQQMIDSAAATHLCPPWFGTSLLPLHAHHFVGSVVCVCVHVLLAWCGLCSLATYILSRLHISLRDLPVACAPQTLQPKNFGTVREAASSDDWKVSFTLTTCKSVACCKHWTDKKWREVQTLRACKFGVANCSRKFQGALVPNTCFQSEVLGPSETKTIYIYI